MRHAKLRARPCRAPSGSRRFQTHPSPPHVNLRLEGRSRGVRGTGLGRMRVAGMNALNKTFHEGLIRPSGCSTGQHPAPSTFATRLQSSDAEKRTWRAHVFSGNGRFLDVLG